MRSYFFPSVLGIITICSFLGIYSFWTTNSTHDCKVLRLHIRSMPILDPRKACFIKSASCLVLPMIYDGLTRIGFDGTPQLSLASSFNVDKSGLVYLFKIKRTLWCDGTTVCSRDFAESWRSALSPNFPSSSASSLLFCIRNAKKIKNGELDPKMLGVYTPNDEELLIELEHAIPQALFFELLSKPPFFAAGSYIEGFRHLYNGPYIPSLWENSESINISETQLNLRRNPCYSEAPFFNTVKLFVIDDEQLPIDLFVRNELDWIGSPTLFLSSDFFFSKQSNESEIVTYKHPISTILLICNTKSKDLENRALRKMLYHSINRDLLCSRMGKDYMSAHTIFPPHISELLNIPFAHNIEEVILPKENPKWSLLFPRRWANDITASILRENIENDLGVSIRLNAQGDWTTFLVNMMKTNFQLCLYRWLWIMENPADFFSVFCAQNCEYSLMDSKILEEQSNNFIKNGFFSLSNGDIESHILENVPVIPIMFEPFRAIKRKELQNFIVLPGGQIDFSKCIRNPSE